MKTNFIVGLILLLASASPSIHSEKPGFVRFKIKPPAIGQTREIEIVDWSKSKSRKVWKSGGGYTNSFGYTESRRWRETVLAVEGFAFNSVRSAYLDGKFRKTMGGSDLQKGRWPMIGKTYLIKIEDDIAKIRRADGKEPSMDENTLVERDYGMSFGQDDPLLVALENQTVKPGRPVPALDPYLKSLTSSFPLILHMMTNWKMRAIFEKTEPCNPGVCAVFAFTISLPLDGKTELLKANEYVKGKVKGRFSVMLDGRIRRFEMAGDFSTKTFSGDTTEYTEGKFKQTRMYTYAAVKIKPGNKTKSKTK